MTIEVWTNATEVDAVVASGQEEQRLLERPTLRAWGVCNEMMGFSKDF